MNLNNMQLDKQKKILIVIFFALIIYVDSSFILKAQRAGLKSLDSKISRLNTDLVNLNSGLENMRLSKSKLESGEQKKAPRSLGIFSEGRISELLQEISNTANKFNIKISQIRPSRAASKEKGPSIQGKFVPMLINLDLISDYHSFGRFIQDLENSLVFVEVQELKISTQLPDYMKQKVNLVLKAYVTK
ncbi:MAG: type 4a pilus biogenesis protein PilO [Candidatus Omnitrophica bacterium]|nr:type 4a pilus biogenesis protein PilO [Candidatus Omnitrophota bacterium]